MAVIPQALAHALFASGPNLRLVVPGLRLAFGQAPSPLHFVEAFSRLASGESYAILAIDLQPLLFTVSADEVRVITAGELGLDAGATTTIARILEEEDEAADFLDDRGSLVDPPGQSAAGENAARLADLIFSLEQSVGELDGSRETALQQILGLSAILDQVLDNAEEEAGLLISATDRAVTQVIDMRIGWLEKEPEVSTAEVLLTAVFLAVVEVGAGRLATSLLARAVRGFQRLSFRRALADQKNLLRSAHGAADRNLTRQSTRLQALERARYEARRLERFHQTASPRENLTHLPSGRGATAAQRKAVSARQQQPTRSAIEAQQQRLRAIEAERAQLSQEMEQTLRQLHELQKKMSKPTITEPLGKKQLREALMAASRVKTMEANVGFVTGKVIKALTEKLPDLAKQDLREEPEADKQQTKGEPKQAQGNDTVLTLVKSQSAAYHRRVVRQLRQMRRVVQDLRERASAFPASRSTILPVLREVCVSMAQPTLPSSALDQMERDLSLEVEFTIWSLLLTLRYVGREVSTVRLRSDEPGVYFVLKGAPESTVDSLVEVKPNRTVDYLLSRFASILGTNPQTLPREIEGYSRVAGSDDYYNLVQKMQERRNTFDRQLRDAADSDHANALEQQTLGQILYSDPAGGDEGDDSDGG